MADNIVGKLLWLIGIDRSGLKSDVEGVQQNIKTMSEVIQREINNSANSVDVLKIALKSAQADVIAIRNQILAFKDATPEVMQASSAAIEKYGVQIDEARAKVTSLQEQLKSLKATSTETTGSMGSAANLVEKIWRNAAIRLAGYFLIFKAAEFVKNTIDIGAAAEGVQQKFNELNQPDLLDKLRQATRGAVADLDLMKTTMKAVGYNVPLDELIQGLKYVSLYARETGGNIDELTQKLVEGLGRQTPRVLAEIGIPADELKNKIKEVGGSFETAFGQIVQQKIENIGDVTSDTSDKMSHLGASIKNLQLQMGEEQNPNSGAFARFLTLMIDKFKEFDYWANKVNVDNNKALGNTSDPRVRKQSLSGIGASPDAPQLEVTLPQGTPKKLNTSQVDEIMKDAKNNTLEAQLTGIEVKKTREEERQILENLNKQNIVLEDHIKIRQRLLELNKNNDSDSKKSQKLDDSNEKKYYESLKFDAAGYLDYRKKQINDEADAIAKATKSELAGEQYKIEELKKLKQEYTDWQVKQAQDAFTKTDLARRTGRTPSITGTFGGVFSDLPTSMDGVKQPQDKPLDQVNKQTDQMIKKAQNTDPFNVAVSGLSSIERLTSQINSLMGKAADPFTKGLQEALGVINAIYEVAKSIEAIQAATAVFSTIASGGTNLASAAAAAAIAPSTQNTTNHALLDSMKQTNASIQALNMNMSSNSGKIPPIQVFSSDPTVRVKYDIGIRNGLENKGVNTSQIRAGGTT